MIRARHRPATGWSLNSGPLIPGQRLFPSDPGAHAWGLKPLKVLAIRMGPLHKVLIHKTLIRNNHTLAKIKCEVDFFFPLNFRPLSLVTKVICEKNELLTNKLTLFGGEKISSNTWEMKRAGGGGGGPEALI